MSKPLNYIISEAVFAAIEKWASEGVRFHPTDIYQVIENHPETKKRTDTLEREAIGEEFINDNHRLTETIVKLKAELASTMSSLTDINDCLNMITMERDQLADQVAQLEEVNIELKMVASHALQAMNETAEAGMRAARDEDQPAP